ncbi:hypothetical protein LTR53_019409, partial [Teratosphaeriaceae sp. CCFEE 6253]
MAPIHMTNADALQELSKQYLGALYLSRMSLAYFTKGPLSRARAAFSDPASALELSNLTAFLREAIMTASMADKKYRDAVSGVVIELPHTGLKTPEENGKAQKKRKWKSKRDKTGLLQDEKEYVE